MLLCGSSISSNDGRNDWYGGTAAFGLPGRLSLFGVVLDGDGDGVAGCLCEPGRLRDRPLDVNGSRAEAKRSMGACAAGVRGE